MFGAKRDGLEVIGVVLNCGNWFEEAARLMDLTYEKYHSFTALDAGEMVRVLPVSNGTQETVVITAGAKLCAPIPKDSVPVLEFDLPDEIEAGAEKGENVGRVSLLMNGEVLSSVPLVVSETLAVRDYAFELERLISNWPVQVQSMAE